jgi:hypothetical protein
MKINLFLVENFSNVVFCSPQTGHYLKKNFFNFIELGIPMSLNLLNSLDLMPKEGSKKMTDSIRIVHAPSSTDRKGSKIIYSIIDEMKNEGYDIDFQVFTGMQNHEILEKLPYFDIAIDQLWSDIPMPVFAMECCAMNVPVIVCGYGWEHLNEFWSKEKWPPTVKGSPEELYELIKDLIDDPQKRIDVARRQKEYVHKNRNPEIVASNLLEIIQHSRKGNVDPSNIRYEYGAASSRDAIDCLVSAMQ